MFPYGDFLSAINTIPDEGTLLREESSSQVWIIQNRTRALAPLHPSGTVHVLWDGALAQIPLPQLILAGVVTDMRQAPLSDASVLITSTSVIPSAGGNTEQLSTDSHGQYSSSFLPAGVYSVSASQDGFVPQAKSVTVREGVPITPLNFQLERTVAFTLTGRVSGRGSDNTTAPIVSTVRLTENSAVPGIITTKTDSGGHYSITLDPGPYNGDYTIDVTALGFASQSITITIPNGNNPVVDFTLDKQGSLTGHVTDEQNLPLGGASASLGGPQTFTDVTGWYSIMVDPGPYTATVTLTGFRTHVASVKIPVGGTLVHDVSLARAVLGSITGTVTDDTGAGLDATVVIPGASTRTDVNGSFTVANVPPGTYKATASAGRHYTPDTETVTVNEGRATVVNFILTLKSIRLADHPPKIFEDGLAS